jgi:hypothetical protein
MSVRGALSMMPAEDVLEWVARKKLTAPIGFERQGVVRTLAIEDGGIAWASSNRRDEQLGAILARSGLVGERALAESLEARAETGVPLGKVLLMSGLISEIDLVEILATKIREAVTDIVTWNEGAFDVVPQTQPAATGVNARLPIEICLTEARRRAARMSEIIGIIGADDVTFYVPPSATPPSVSQDSLVDLAKLWALAGDRHTAANIAASFSGQRFATYDGLARMVEAGRLVIDGCQRERANSAVELAAGARGRLRQGDRIGALAMATSALHQDPSDAEVRKTFAQSERARVAEVARQLLSRHRIPKRVKELSPRALAELGLSEAEIALASRVDGRWDLLSLVRAANTRQAEALLAFAHLAELGVVELG